MLQLWQATRHCHTDKAKVLKSCIARTSHEAIMSKDAATRPARCACQCPIHADICDAAQIPMLKQASWYKYEPSEHLPVHQKTPRQSCPPKKPEPFHNTSGTAGVHHTASSVARGPGLLQQGKRAGSRLPADCCCSLCFAAILMLGILTIVTYGTGCPTTALIQISSW
jgi:hypothetical protein